MKILLSFFTLLIFFFVQPANLNSAEILQIKNSNTILIGDQNRNLSINLVCSVVDLKNEKTALDLLRKNFPRGTKVKIKPIGFKDQNLLAKIYKLDENIEMNDLLHTYNLSDQICDN